MPDTFSNDEWMVFNYMLAKCVIPLVHFFIVILVFNLSSFNLLLLDFWSQNTKDDLQQFLGMLQHGLVGGLCYVPQLLHNKEKDIFVNI